MSSLNKKRNPEIGRNLSTTCQEVFGRVAGRGVSFLSRGLLIFAAALLLGCSAPEVTHSEQVIPEESGFTYDISASTLSIQISGGNLHWHKRLPDITYTLEDATIEIYNFGDVDILVAQLEMRVDESTRLFDVNMVIGGMTKTSLVVQPVMEGYDGSTHTVYVALLDEHGEILCRSGWHEVGPLEPIPGTGSWQQVQN